MGSSRLPGQADKNYFSLKSKTGLLLATKKKEHLLTEGQSIHSFLRTNMSSDEQNNTEDASSTIEFLTLDVYKVNRDEDIAFTDDLAAKLGDLGTEIDELKSSVKEDHDALVKENKNLKKKVEILEARLEKLEMENKDVAALIGELVKDLRSGKKQHTEDEDEEPEEKPPARKNLAGTTARATIQRKSGDTLPPRGEPVKRGTSRAPPPEDEDEEEPAKPPVRRSLAKKEPEPVKKTPSRRSAPVEEEPEEEEPEEEPAKPPKRIITTRTNKGTR